MRENGTQNTIPRRWRIKIAQHNCRGSNSGLISLFHIMKGFDVSITLAGIACIIMREVYATIGESIYPNPSFLSRDFPEASG